MNLGEANIVLRHRPALEVVDLTIRFVRGLAPTRFLVLGLWLLLPAWGAFLLARRAELSWIWVWPLALASARLLELPFTVLTSRLLFEKEVPLREVQKDSLRALLPLTWGLFLYSLLFVASSFLIVAPLFVGANYFFLPEVIVLEKSGPFRAFRRSHRFLSGRSGTGLEAIVLRTGLLLSFILLSETLGQVLVTYGLSIAGPQESLWSDGGSAFALFGLFVFVPYGAAHRFLAYINERTRQDGWDVQVAFLALKTGSLTSSEGSRTEEKKHAP